MQQIIIERDHVLDTKHREMPELKLINVYHISNVSKCKCAYAQT